ncbi:Gti1/Pac2 family-domain-containing protein [Halteromyces radiatus]|uniref:Gti1/Pac2 family-domain-containing protein n=1 Tax=Halteromyces radiatus TaxID=101107 RepID=UPI00221F391F|nr:Gti1/Pac2 family-domain-containing protein [Halteromyces radiatus]KAI8089177.1 Gti1/Pac2 family-domain-containing protein [Halteromyces radiatus]
METFIGHIKTPQDALIIFEACRRGMLHRVKRRLSTKERINIQSGSIFAFDEAEAGMRRWTDGRTWSPSRVLGSFLTYRELDTKRRPRRHSSHAGTCSYKPNGLIKQSFSICTASNQKMHLISYYSKADVIKGKLTLPSMDLRLGNIVIPKGFYPELNPLDTSGGHSATLHLMMKASIENQQRQHTNSPSPPSSPTTTTTTTTPLNHSEKDHGLLLRQQPPSLSSSPLSVCSDDDLLSPSHTLLPFTSHHVTTASSNGTQQSLSATLTSKHSPIMANQSTQPLLPPVQVWKPYSLQSEDTRQLEALKAQLRI